MEILFWPFVSIISIGLMGLFLGFQGNIMNFVLTGAITSGILQVTQLDVAYSMLYAVWSKSVKHTFLAPINHLHYLLGSWIIGIIRGTLVFLLMLIFSHHYFGFDLPDYSVTVIFLLGVFLNGLVLGILVCTLVICGADHAFLRDISGQISSPSCRSFSRAYTSNLFPGMDVSSFAQKRSDFKVI